MASFPVPINKNLDGASIQLPVAGDGTTPLGGVKVDGVTIVINEEGIISVAGGGGGNVIGTGTDGFIPIWTGSNTIADSLMDYGVSLPGSFSMPSPLQIVDDSDGSIGSSFQMLPQIIGLANTYSIIYIDDSGIPDINAQRAGIEISVAANNVGNENIYALLIDEQGTGDFIQAIHSDSVAPSNFAGSLAMPLLVLKPSSQPGVLTDGQIWYDSTANALKCYVNGAVKTITVS